MNGKGWILTWLSMALLFVSSLVVMVSTSPSSADDARPKMVIVLDHGVPVPVRVEDMAEGESRSIPMDGQEVLVSRNGHGLTAEVDGRTLLPELVVLPGDGHRMKVFLHQGDGEGLGDIEIHADKATVLSGEEPSIEWVSDDGEKKIRLAADARLMEFELPELADGESRTFPAGDGELVVTRAGDFLRLKMDGEELSEITGPADRAQPARLILLRKGKEGGEPGTGQFEWTALTTDGGKKSKTVMIVADETSAAESGTFVWQSDDKGKKHKTYAVTTTEGGKGDVECITISEGPVGQQRKVELEYHSAGERLTITIDDESAEMSTADFPTGETRTVPLGDHTLRVTREEDTFRFTLDGEELSNMVFHMSGRSDDDGRSVVRERKVHRRVEKAVDVEILETEEGAETRHVFIKALGPGRDVLICSTEGVLSLAVESLRDGESRDMSLGEDEVVVTREGDRLRLEINGTVLYY